ncbi:uncharacterized protein LOC144663275 [Oculina patagonica]
MIISWILLNERDCVIQLLVNPNCNGKESEKYQERTDENVAKNSDKKSKKGADRTGKEIAKNSEKENDKEDGKEGKDVGKNNRKGNGDKTNSVLVKECTIMVQTSRRGLKIWKGLHHIKDS